MPKNGQKDSDLWLFCENSALDNCSILLWMTWYSSTIIFSYLSKICGSSIRVNDRYDTFHSAKYVENCWRDHWEVLFKWNRWYQRFPKLYRKRRRKKNNGEHETESLRQEQNNTHIEKITGRNWTRVNLCLQQI